MDQTLERNEHQVAISAEAMKEMESILEKDEYKGKAVRLVIAGMGCSGPQLGLALDEPNTEDVILEGSNFQMLADNAMKQQILSAGGLNIEFVNDPYQGSGIMIQFANAGSCSTGGCSGCGC